MWKSVLTEAREIAWLASIVGGLSVVSVGIAIAIGADWVGAVRAARAPRTCAVTMVMSSTSSALLFCS